MKHKILFSFVFLAFISCNKEQKQCDESESKLLSQKYYGVITICNGDSTLTESAELSLIEKDLDKRVEAMMVYDFTERSVDLGVACSMDKQKEYNTINFLDKDNGHDIGFYNPETQEVKFSFYYNEDCTSATFVGKPEA